VYPKEPPVQEPTGYTDGTMSEDILDEARRLADDVFRPQAQAADQGDIHGQVEQNVRALGAAGYFGLGIPLAFGGLGADDVARREYTELMASACGVTAFVQQQLHAGGGFVGGGRSEALKREKLPRFADGTELCGVAFSHLRRPGPPMVRAERVEGGYRVSGVAPWVTGWGILDSFILGAVRVPDNDHIYFYVPKVDVGKSLVPGPRIPLVVMNASDTVEVTLSDLFIPDDHVLYDRPAAFLLRSDHCGISGHVFLPLGCARGSVHYLTALADRRGSDSVRAATEELSREISDVRREALEWSGACAELADYKDHALHARASAITLAVRAAHAAVTAMGGSAHLLSQPPQRLLRESIFYTTTAQTADVQSATLDLLTSPDCWSAE